MKKTKLFVFCALIICLACLFTACSSGSGIFSEKTYDANNFVTLYASAQKLDLDGYDLEFSRGPLSLFSKAGAAENQMTYRLYDLEKNAKIVDKTIDVTTDEFLLDSLTIDGETIPFFTVKIATIQAAEIDYTFTLYSAAGEKIADYTDKVAPDAIVTKCEDLVIFNQKAYRFTADGKVKEAFALTDLSAPAPNVDEKVGSYYYAYDLENNDITVYDETLRVIYHYDIPVYATQSRAFTLENGAIFLQYYVEKFDDDTDYDVLKQVDAVWKKFGLKQMLINPKKGSIKNLKNEYALVGGANRISDPEVFNGLNKKYKNYAAIYEIKDKYVLDDDLKFALLDNNGKISILLSAFAEEWMDIDARNSTRIVTEGIGRSYLYTYKGKQIGDITGYVEMTEKYIVGAKVIYDLDLKVVLDLKAKNYTYLNTLGNNILVTDKDGKVILFNGTEKALDTTVEKFSKKGTNLYTVLNNAVYTLYNNDGASVNATSANPFFFRRQYKQFALVSTTDANGSVYYRVA